MTFWLLFLSSNEVSTVCGCIMEGNLNLRIHYSGSSTLHKEIILIQFNQCVSSSTYRSGSYKVTVNIAAFFFLENQRRLLCGAGDRCAIVDHEIVGYPERLRNNKLECLWWSHSRSMMAKAPLPVM